MSESLSTRSVSSLSNSGYMPQLDSLRAIAVFLVLLEHWIIEGHWFKVLPFGVIGVTLFFVLSGFLITQILLKSRDVAEEKNENRFHSVKQFYIRRFLRIFPIYYITLIILYIVNARFVRERILWYVFYALNIYYFETRNWVGPTGHFWTLCVEEQFYVIWPFVILFTPRKYLFKAIIAVILLGPFFRAGLSAFYDPTAFGTNFINKLTPSCMDSLGLGALLAYLRVNHNEMFTLKNFWSAAFLICNILSLVIVLFFYPLVSKLIPGIYVELIIRQFFVIFNISVISFYLISKVSIGFTGLLKIIFENNLLMYLGKISYGLYLFHNFIPDIYIYFMPPIQNFYLRFAVYNVLLVFIASASWLLIERPINNLKRYFAYN